MRYIWFCLAQCTWGLLQSLMGSVLFLLYRKREHRFYKGAIVTYWLRRDGISLGMFLFLGHSSQEQSLLAHEYGHSIQSLILGPLYLPIIGLPSFLWAGLPCFQRLRRKKRISYYRFYPEKWANHLGTLVTKEKITL